MQIQNIATHSLPSFREVGVALDQFQMLQTSQVEARCEVIRTQIQQSQIPPNQRQSVFLQIAQDYIIERTSNGQQILSAFKCDYEIQFQITRVLTTIPNTVGAPTGINFLFRQHLNQSIKFTISPQSQNSLQIFARILGCKFIVQLGFHNLFKATKKIGKGMTACVYHALNLLTGGDVAIKSFKRQTYFEQDNNNGRIAFLQEFKMLTQVNHKNICQLYGVYESDNSTYIVLELYPLSLFGHIQRHGFPNRQQIKITMTHLLKGIAYLHDKGLMHRDLKLENIMVRKDSRHNGKMMPVIIDLGLAEYTNSQHYLYLRCGTPGYVAPQVLAIRSTDAVQTYTSACDIFSLGVILHILLFRRPIFEGQNPREVIRRNSECQINYQTDAMRDLGQQGLDLLRRMLAREPSNRISALAALQHPFLQHELVETQLQNPVHPQM